jgi:pimeloyl-ACP methyl ester carboxylesterase
MTLNPKQRYFLSASHEGFKKIAYVEWGKPTAKRTFICVHGMTRNGRDFDYLAKALVKTYDCRVVCPDLIGRGMSDWFEDASRYKFAQYIADMNALIARLDVEDVEWIGTSLGGMIGIVVAAMPNSPIKRLIVNDVGPHVPRFALLRIAKYIKKCPELDTLQQVEVELRERYAPFGTLSDKHWAHIVKYGHKKLDNGKFIFNYDPRIVNIFWILIGSNIWSSWDSLTCPVMVIHGENSDILTNKTLEKMRILQPKTHIYSVADTGHAPALMADDQVQAIVDWVK